MQYKVEMITQFNFPLLLGLVFFTSLTILRTQWKDVTEGKWLEYQDNVQIYTFEEFSDHHDFNTTFFIESSNAEYLDPRQSCCVEAAVRAQHPYSVAVYMTGIKSDTIQKKNEWINEFSNLKLIHLDADKFFTNGNLERIYNEVKSKSKRKIEHEADLARIALLKKFGGFYVDLDTVLMKPTTQLSSFLLKNFANGIMKYRKGHQIIEEIYRRLNETKSSPVTYTEIGKDLIRRVVEDICHFKRKKNNFAEAAKICNITFLNEETFLPVFWGQWRSIFGKPIKLDSFKVATMNAAYAIHFSSSLTSDIPIIGGKGQIFDQIARKYCPTVHRMLPKFY
ncbi:lactosylceramide 4-alpha-galactosyltransferase-like isoform X2 [Artemia franciscana]|uniref:lactosylceramide 4-alpha-galactosyltransferase-like isoform X2 n=1 Tax=Artemia franciscana TaxID=6661 RepID=UPI0032DA9233